MQKLDRKEVCQSFESSKYKTYRKKLKRFSATRKSKGKNLSYLARKFLKILTENNNIHLVHIFSRVSDF